MSQHCVMAMRFLNWKFHATPSLQGSLYGKQPDCIIKAFYKPRTKAHPSAHQQPPDLSRKSAPDGHGRTRFTYTHTSLTHSLRGPSATRRAKLCQTPPPRGAPPGQHRSQRGTPHWRPARRAGAPAAARQRHPPAPLLRSAAKSSTVPRPYPPPAAGRGRPAASRTEQRSPTCSGKVAALLPT